MTKDESYYDWEIALHSKTLNAKKKRNKEKISNPLDIPHKEFKKFIKIWKRKNKIY